MSNWFASKREVFYGIVWNRDQVAGHCLVIVVDTLDREVVVVRTLAAHGRSDSDSQRTRLRDSWTQQGKVQHTRASSSGRRNAQVLREPRIIGGLQLRRGRVDGRSHARDFNGLAGRTQCQREIQSARLVEHDIDLLNSGLKTGCSSPRSYKCLPEGFRNGMHLCCRCRRGGYSRVDFRRFDTRVRHHRGRRIDDRAYEVAANSLAVCPARTSAASTTNLTPEGCRLQHR